MEFFGISTGGNFDIVSALIHGIGDAWNAIREPIMAVIEMYTTFTESLYGVVTGQMDLQTAVMNIWNSLATNIPVVLQFIYTYLLSFVVQLGIYAIQAGLNFVNGIISYVSQLPGRVMTYLIQVLTNVIAQTSRWVSTARSRANQLVTGVVAFLRQLPSRALSALLGVVTAIVSAGVSWVSNARSKASEVVSSVTNTLSGLPGKISGAISGVVDAITKPFKDAYNTLTGIVDDIKSKASEVANISLPAFGGDIGPMGGDLEPVSANSSVVYNANGNTVGSSESLTVDINQNVTLDLANVPQHIDTNSLISALSNRDVLRALVENRDFQSIDAQVKERINYKVNRSRGI